MRIQNFTVVLLVTVGLLAACRASEPSPASPLSPLSPVATPSLSRPTLAAPLADGAMLLTERCTSCHNLDRVTGAPREREEWAQVIARMVGRGAELSDAEQAILLDYLAQTYGP